MLINICKSSAGQPAWNDFSRDGMAGMNGRWRGHLHFLSQERAFLLPILGLRSDGIVAHLISMGKVTGIRPVLTLCALSHLHILRRLVITAT